MEKFNVQIDIKGITLGAVGLVTGVLYTGSRAVTIQMLEADYKELMRDGFFIRDGKTKDSANVINTTEVYKT